MRRAAKVDEQHGEIVKALRQVGCQVRSLAAVGSGCPDLLVRVPGKRHMVLENDLVWVRVNLGARLVLMEVKADKGKLNMEQVAFHALWPETQIVRSVQEALHAIGVTT